MEFDWPTYFECAACSAAHPAEAVEYDALGYPFCPECGARTGPLASLEAAETVENASADIAEGGVVEAFEGGAAD